MGQPTTERMGQPPCRVSSVENVATALTANGLIGGGVAYFGHSGTYIDTTINGRISILGVGNGNGGDTNVTFRNVSQLAAVQTANNGSNILGTTTSILINGCRAGLTIYDSYALYETSIAQMISNNTKRGVYAYKVGLYMSLHNASSATSSNYLGEPNPIPYTLPLYYIPEGPPGNKPGPLSFTPQ